MFNENYQKKMKEKKKKKENNNNNMFNNSMLNSFFFSTFSFLHLSIIIIFHLHHKHGLLSYHDRSPFDCADIFDHLVIAASTTL